MCRTKRLNAFSDYTRPVRYFFSARVYLLLVFMDKIAGKGKTSLHCNTVNGAKCSGISVRNGANDKVEVCALSYNLCIICRYNFYES